jgi:hypothetical protein
MSIPLPFFTHKSLRYIIDNLALLPLRKVEADGIHKKGTIIDIEKLSKTLGEELSLSFGQYGEASGQMFKFQSQRDRDPLGTEGSWTSFWQSHFSFFENRDDAEEFYDEWKTTELDLRRERWSYGYRYNTEHYSSRYLTAKNNMIQRLKFEEEMKRLRMQLEPKNRNYSAGPSRSAYSKPFQRQEGGRRSLPPASFAQTVHTPSTSTHLESQNSLTANLSGRNSTAINFAPLTVVKSVSNSTSLDTDIAAFKKIDTVTVASISAPSVATKTTTLSLGHAATGMLHICSFCGDKNHHALSWTCRKRDA